MVMITQSGIDERTDLDSLCTYNNYSFDVEYAILLSANPEGRNRYPSLEWIRKAILKNLNLAVHICGSDARKNALAGEYNDILQASTVSRVQVNGKVSPEEVKSFCRLLPYSIIITQDCPANEGLASIPYDPNIPNHQILIDGSGGRGIERADWNLPEHLKSFKNAIGFAGGLGPDNLADALPKIKANKLRCSPWIDMESKLRDENDWFSVELSQKCIDIALAD